VAVFLSGVGILLGLVGAFLLYVFHDPKFGSGLMLEAFDPRRQKVGARGGLLLVIVGAALQFAAVFIAMD
jgi:hypothetical protein